ncbi:Ig-like domain-containing protein [Lysinibacillus parviboronicapiens]|uniref:Ig-like domain-containing protein n=1 Tax=Lysinibacillus parviboronicapiens TaxID=436516 RepID=UPI00187D4A24|nr:Ig-like domain-containing protein [Lysinibacillus parviboronicapiens]
MKKILMIISATIAILFSYSLLDIEGNKAKAATIGEQLKEPESGWQRFDDREPLIKFPDTAGRLTYATAYNKTYSTGGTDPTKLVFLGTKIRLIADLGDANSTRAHVNYIKIDGEEYSFNQGQSSQGFQSQILLFEKSNLPYGRHTVEIYSKTTTYSIDAIDIDESGKLLDPNEIIVDSLKLNKETLDLTVGSSETLVATVTPDSAKVIQWTSSDPEIASVDSNGNVIGKKAGKVTITAATTDGSNLSATAEVTVKEAEIDVNRAILRLTMSTKDIHEYDLSLSEIDQFMNWLDGREVGQGKPYYKFKLNVTIGNIVSRTEYIMYDKIVSFTVDDYK